MGLNRAFDRSFFLIGGNVKKTGWSFNLSKGAVALVDSSKTSASGLKVVANPAGTPKDKKVFSLRCGIDEREPTRSYSNKDFSTMPFSLSEIKELRVSAPKNTRQKLDEVILGYNGMDADSAFNFQTGDTYFRLSLELKGGAVAYRGGEGDTEVVNINVEIPECNPFDDCVECDECSAVDCRDITLKAIERLKEKQLTGGMTVGELVDITPVFSCDTDASVQEVAYNYYCLEVCDTGTPEALALVQAQYDTQVIRTDRVGSTSKYQVLLPASAGTPGVYEQTLASIIKGCADCPDGWSATPEGVLYAITLEDDGSDASATIDGILGVVAASATIVTGASKEGNSAGVGFYTVLLDRELTDDEITAFVNNSTTSTLESLGTVASLCENATVTETAWSQCGTCNVIEETYTIVVPDDECGNTIEDKIGYNYDSAVTVATTTGTGIELTLTGTSGTANITIDGVDYLATFDTDLTTTADNFVTAHAADILANHSMNVSAAAGVLTFSAVTSDFVAPTITNATGDLAGTLVAEAPATVPDRNGCQTRYQTTVVSNIVCEECDPMFKDYYVTEAPEPYDIYEWEKVENPDALPSGNCLCGIKFKSKEFVIDMEESLRDHVGFTETSVQIRVSGGYPKEIREGIGRLPQGTYKVTYLERWEPRTHLAGNLRDMENENRFYFKGAGYRKDDYLARLIRGEITNMEEQGKQYVQYTLVVSHFNHTQSFAGRINEDINYNFFVEVGRHQDIEDLLNAVATAAGKNTVQAFGA